ncbi:MAG: SDR family NAD(P)-dependent oxidoreductase [Cyanothece sp. SIO2G6]|nr:SDR family NAD(P)-dependent oxidoreductase [Cyanothece sp. SIO2G6]
MSEQVQQQVALVTGASSGIGRAIAQRLAVGGYHVVVCARRLERLTTLVDEVTHQGGIISAIPADLRQEAEILNLFNAIRQQWGGVDVLVNNAGLGHKEPLMSGDTEHWREMLEVNVLALCICTREAIQDMQTKGGQGHIIHINSMSGHRVPGASGVYSATKHAVSALTEGLRLELRAAGSPIRVSAISPGYVETEFAEKYAKSADHAKAIYSQFPVLQPEDIAEAVWYVLSQPPHVQVHDILVRSTQQPS